MVKLASSKPLSTASVTGGCGCPSIVNVTVPPGVLVPVLVTNAVKVTASPTLDAPFDEVTRVAVASSGAAFTTWLKGVDETLDCAVEPGEDLAGGDIERWTFDQQPVRCVKARAAVEVHSPRPGERGPLNRGESAHADCSIGRKRGGIADRERPSNRRRDRVCRRPAGDRQRAARDRQRPSRRQAVDRVGDVV